MIMERREVTIFESCYWPNFSGHTFNINSELTFSYAWRVVTGVW
jgi:hypothetical protein